ncbi:MAG: thymidine kinase [Bradymonadales bacterium]|nr:thymidine kinase [Bradymonadales bacterium]
MAKLYFRYGAMGSAKTMNLLAVAHNYEQQGKRVILIKPSIDDRFGADMIRSRTGLERKADICVAADTQIPLDTLAGVSCILVDECQFLSEYVVHQLRNITVDLDIPVICYGLRTNFKTRLFEGAKRLMEVADAIEEVKTTCAFCNRKAVFNIKLRHGNACTTGTEIELGAEDLYQPTCCRCFEARIGHDNPLRDACVDNGIDDSLSGSDKTNDEVQTPEELAQSPDRVELWLVRHGETVENSKAILSGWIEAQLSEKGIAQAKTLAPVLAPVHFDAAFVSPLQRAKDTAHYAGMNPTVVEAIKEFSYGDYDGQRLDDIPKQWVDDLFAFNDFKTPNGETIEDVQKRATNFIRTLPDGRYILFCHGGTIRSIVQKLGCDRFLDNGTVIVIDWTHKKIIRTIKPYGPELERDHALR